MENEKNIEKYPKTISSKGMEIISEQMKKKVCRISIKNDRGTGFFCKIPYPDDNNLLSVLITNNHIIDESILENEKNILISMNNKDKEIELEDRIKYTNKEYDITIIEIKEKDEIEDFLELDNNIRNKINKSYIGDTIYVLHYPRSEEIGVSYGLFKGVNNHKNYFFNHLCSTEKGSSGGPILNIKNYRVIGMHKGTNKEDNNNIGVFMKFGINDFINKYSNNNLDLCNYYIRNEQKINVSNDLVNNAKKGLNKILFYMNDISKQFNILNNNIKKIFIFPSNSSNKTVKEINEMLNWIEESDNNQGEKERKYLFYYNKLKINLVEYYNKICDIYNNQFFIKIKEFNESIQNILYKLNEFDSPNINNDKENNIEFYSKYEDDSDPFYQRFIEYDNYCENFSGISQEETNKEKNLKCLAHPQKEGIYYCNHCDIIICEECEKTYELQCDHEFVEINKIIEDNLNIKNKFLESFMNIIKEYFHKIDTILKYNKDNFLKSKKIVFPFIKYESDFDCQMNFFKEINIINNKIIGDNDKNNAINESKINNQILLNCIKTTYHNLVGDNLDKIEEIDDEIIDEKFEINKDGEDNEYDIIKNKYLYIINIINENNINFNNDEFNQEILKEISNALNVNKKNILILSNNKRDFFNNFIKTTNFENISPKQIRLKYPYLKLLYEYKLLIDCFFRLKCKISKESFNFKYNFIIPNSSLNNRRGKEIYYPPYGWLGIGLNVNNKYDKMDNSWLNKNDSSSEWAIGYYLFKNLNSDEIINQLNSIIMNNDLYLNEKFQIKMDCFNERLSGEKIQRIGKGYYLCSDINKAEKNTGYISFNNKKYKILLMAKILINNIKEPDDGSFWIIKNKEDIRIYRILLKEFL